MIPQASLKRLMQISNKPRESFDFKGTGIKIIFRKRKED